MRPYRLKALYMIQLKSKILVTAVLVGCASFLTLRAEDEPAHDNFGSEKAVLEIYHIEIKNMKGERLGRIKEVAVDLSNGRIVEVLVGSGGFLSIGEKIVGAPPLALVWDPIQKVYVLDVSAAVFKSAPEIDRAYWQDTGRSVRIAAAYHLFGQTPYFLEEGATPSKTASRPKVSLGYVERSVKLMGMPVKNLQNEKLGEISGIMMDIPKGSLGNVIIRSLDHSNTKSIVPATALNFNASRKALLLDDSKEEFADEPRYSFSAAANGQAAHSKEETYQGPRTTAALEQGGSYADLDRTARINRRIRIAKIDVRNVEVGTLNGRVTLRGWVNTGDDKRIIEEIAITASRLELVDDQITVGKPAPAVEIVP